MRITFGLEDGPLGVYLMEKYPAYVAVSQVPENPSTLLLNVLVILQYYVAAVPLFKHSGAQSVRMSSSHLLRCLEQKFNPPPPSQKQKVSLLLSTVMSACLTACVCLLVFGPDLQY